MEAIEMVFTPLLGPELTGIGMLLWCAIMVLALWDMVWKGIGMWKAGRNNHLGWFIAILIFNTVGILPIIYIAFFSKPKKVAKRR
jgi:hypothetical protein